MSNKRTRICKKLRLMGILNTHQAAADGQVKGRRSRTCKRRNQRRKQKSRKQKNRKKQVTWGGDYIKDFTSTTLEGIPTKSLHRFTAVVPGYPVMSGQSYKQLMENIDRNGPDM